MEYQKYQEARKASWKLLVDLKISELPVKILSILKALNIPVYGYSKHRDFIVSNGLDGRANTCNCFTAVISDRYCVFYNEDKPVEHIRFLLARELGHIVCGHLLDEQGNKLLETAPLNSDYEREANTFASRLLAPMCVLHELGLSTAEQIAEVCQISIQSATYRLERLKMLEARHEKFLNTRGFGCFYSNSLEREVYNQFKDYIEKNKL